MNGKTRPTPTEEKAPDYCENGEKQLLNFLSFFCCAHCLGAGQDYAYEKRLSIKALRRPFNSILSSRKMYPLM